MSAVADRVEVLGCEIDRVDMDEAARRCDAYVSTRAGAQHMAVNAAKLVAMRRDDGAAADRRRLRPRHRRRPGGRVGLAAARRPAADARRRHRPDARACGARGAARLSRLHPRRSGGRARTAVARLRALHPRLVFAGYRDGYFSDAEEPSVAAEIRAARPDLLFVAMTTPRKEYFLGRRGAELDVPVLDGRRRRGRRRRGRDQAGAAAAAAARARVGLPPRAGAAAAVPSLSGHELHLRCPDPARRDRGQSTPSRSCALSRTTSASASCAAVNGPVATAMQRSAVGARAGDVARRVADDHRLLARVAARAGAGDGGQLEAVLVVGAEAALAVLEEAPSPARASLRWAIGSRLPVSTRQAHAVARVERLEHLDDPGRDVGAEVVGAQARVGLRGRDAEVVAAVVEALGAHPAEQRELAGDLEVGAPGRLRAARRGARSARRPRPSPRAPPARAPRRPSAAGCRRCRRGRARRAFCPAGTPAARRLRALGRRARQRPALLQAPEAPDRERHRPRRHEERRRRCSPRR